MVGGAVLVGFGLRILFEENPQNIKRLDSQFAAAELAEPAEVLPTLRGS